MMTSNKKGYCYGWIRNFDDIIEANTKVRLYSHGGALAGNTSFIAMYDDGTTIIFLSNISGIRAERMIHTLYLTANGLKDEYRLAGYPNRSSFETFKEDGGMTALNRYFDKLSEYSGYTVYPSKSTMTGVMKIHLEANKSGIADSLKNAYLSHNNPNESELNSVAYNFLNSETIEFGLDFFRINVELNPLSANAWDSLGEAFIVAKKRDKALESFKKAVSLAEKSNHRNLKLFRKNLNSVQ